MSLQPISHSAPPLNKSCFKRPFHSTGRKATIPKKFPIFSSIINLHSSVEVRRGRKASENRNRPVLRCYSQSAMDSIPAPNRRKVIEHVKLFKMVETLEETAEKDMLDHLYTLQYLYRNVIAISLGRLSTQAKGFTHAFFVRFPNLAALKGFLELPAHSDVLQKYVNPYCQEILSLDFEVEVEETIESIFRRGEEFDQGVERIVLLKVKPDASAASKTNLIKSFTDLPAKIGSGIVQLTAGEVANEMKDKFTHGIVVRLDSVEELENFSNSSEHKEVFLNSVLPLSEDILVADYRVDPVGTKLM